MKATRCQILDNFPYWQRKVIANGAFAFMAVVSLGMISFLLLRFSDSIADMQVRNRALFRPPVSEDMGQGPSGHACHGSYRGLDGDRGRRRLNRPLVNPNCSSRLPSEGRCEAASPREPRSTRPE
jgi:hypothetical protein